MLSLATNTASPERICVIVVNSGNYASQWGFPVRTLLGQVEAGNMGEVGHRPGHVTIRPARKARLFQLNCFDSFQTQILDLGTYLEVKWPHVDTIHEASSFVRGSSLLHSHSALGGVDWWTNTPNHAA
jgi:hypothetical protein